MNLVLIKFSVQLFHLLDPNHTVAMVTGLLSLFFWWGYQASSTVSNSYSILNVLKESNIEAYAHPLMVRRLESG